MQSPVIMLTWNLVCAEVMCFVSRLNFLKNGYVFLTRFIFFNRNSVYSLASINCALIIAILAVVEKKKKLSYFLVPCSYYIPI